MTDDEINRLVLTEVLGYQWYDNGQGVRFLRHPDNFDYKATESGGVITHLAGFPDYCNDPAAWGELLVWMESAPAYESVSITYIRATQRWSVFVHRDKATHIARDAFPGRALALAALRAHGVSP